MSQQWNTPNDAGDDIQVPLGAGGDSAPQEEYSGKRAPKINGSTLTLVLAFASALAALYLLGMQNQPRVASADETRKQTEMEAKINEMLHNTASRNGVKGLFADTSRLIEMLNGYFKPAMDDNDLPRNPFARQLPKIDLPEDVGTLVAKAPEPIAEDPQLRRVSEEFSTLKLQTVMMGSMPAAIVSDQMVTAGAALKSFTVIDIQPDHIVLGWKDKRFRLLVSGQQLNKH